ncbi:MAG: SDR family oxidoreductase [Actinomycetota bacterium]|nr:SDR family oxidoreductase [Actinomycetota bacterium]
MPRTVLVTGGSRGIGRAVAARFAAAGDDVTVTGRDVEALTTTATEIGAHVVACDATSPTDIAALARAVGPELDVLINMAGGNTDLRELTGGDQSLEAVAAAWRANLDANLLSAVLTTAALRDGIRPGGSIINVSTIGAEYAATSYGAAKAAVAAWNAGLSAEVGPAGVTANVIAPGYIAGTEFFCGSLSPERRDALIAATHDKRPGTPDEIADTVFFLASPGARHITGQTIHVNGGAHTTR